MLKLNSSGGKLDITITDDAIFGTSRKPAVKHQREKVISRASNAHGRHQKKQTVQAEKAPKSKESRSTKTVKYAPNFLKQNKLPAREDKKAAKSQVELKTVTDKSNTQGSSVISQAKLDNILSLLNNGEDSGATSLSPEHLSVLVTSLNKMKSAEPQVQKEIHSQSQQNNSQRKSASRVPLSRREHPMKNDKQVEDDKGPWRKELDNQVISKRKAKELEKQKVGAAFEEYNPWGRPGAGAPIRSQTGKVLADYHHRVTKETVEIPKQENSSVLSHGPAFPSQSRLAPVATIGSSTSNVDTTLPVALRSSFAVGAPGLVSNDTQQKRLQELQWKQELEKQIEEKKERDRQRKLKEEQEDLLNLSWSSKSTRAPPNNTPSQVSVGLRTDNPQKPTPGNIVTQETYDDTTSFLNQSLIGSSNRSSHARGFGMHTLDLQSQDEAEKKRLKMLEHQRAIQEQVEENRRKKQQEKEQRLKEEAIEEARLAKEREKLNQAFAIEQKRKKEKEEEAKRISEALQQSVLDAYESAQQAKREKRKKQFEAGSQSRRGGPSSQSYVVSRTSSLSHHGISHERQSELSNYASPRGRDSPRSKPHGHVSKASHSRSLLVESYVPPLNLVRGDSPPVPTLRNRLPKPVNPSSQRSATTPTSVNASHLQRTVSSTSEPNGGSMAFSTRTDTHRSEVEADFLTSLDELSSARFQAEDPPFDTVEEAFMIPYHRTDSATLPAPPDTPQDITPSSTKPGKAKNNVKKSTNKSPGKETVPPMYRSQSTHLKPAKIDAEVSPRRAKGTKPVPKQVLSSKVVVKKPLKDNINNSSQTRTKQVDKKQRSPRIDAALSRLSRQQDIHEALTTPRQELILQQLAALRKGLILKEQELKQGI